MGWLRSLLWLGLVLAVTGECPPSFIHLGDECYYFADEEFARDDAASFCLTLGAHLASFSNCSHFTYVSRYLEVAGIETNGRGFWIGADREFEWWVWTDTNKNFEYGAPFWDPFTPIQSDLDICAYIGADGGYLKPAPCTDMNLPLCEGRVVRNDEDEDEDDEKDNEDEAPKPRIMCPSPFVEVGKRCIYLNHDFLTWDEARTACSQMAPDHFTDLAVLSDCDIFAAVARHMEAQQGEAGVPDWAWVGARDMDGKGNYRWLNGDYTDPGVPFWCPGQPNDFEGHQKCVMLWGTNFFYGADEDCSVIHKSLCEVGF